MQINTGTNSANEEDLIGTLRQIENHYENPPRLIGHLVRQNNLTIFINHFDKVYELIITSISLFINYFIHFTLNFIKIDARW